MTVTTRFAPSPTGFLHIGSARTALFNWLFAKHHNGRFLLRIEDTDRKRSTQEAIDAILDGMNWLGLNPDEPPIFQSQRADRHFDVAQTMLESGHAFKCFVTPKELEARREEAQSLLSSIKTGELNGNELDKAKVRANELLAPYRSPYRDGAAAPSIDADYVVRLRAPDNDRISLKDDVQGDVSLAAGEIDDLILLRSDGTPTYMLAVVVDDHDMGVTQIIRGDDHLTNTFRQLPIYHAMGWNTPDYAHIPLIHGPDGKKLSKRHGALGVEAYRDMGYIPAGVKNYLLRLGWSHGDEEFIPEGKAIDWFNLEAINKGPARMDFEKMGHINGLHLRDMPKDELTGLISEHLAQTEKTLTVETEKRLNIALSDLSERGQTIPDIADAAEFLLVQRPIEISGKAKKKLKSDALGRLREFLINLQNVEDWTAPNLAILVDQFCERNDLSIGQIGPALRSALTGGRPAPDLKLVMFWLGKTEVIGRIEDVLVDADRDQ